MSNIFLFSGSRVLGARDDKMKRLSSCCIGFKELSSRKIGSHDVESTNVSSRKIGSHDVESTNVSSRKIESHDVESTNVSSRKIGSYDIESTNVSSRKIGAHDVESTNVSSRKLESLNPLVGFSESYYPGSRLLKSIAQIIGISAITASISFASTVPSIIKTKFPDATTAMIVETTSGKVLYQLNANVPMQPASDTKILTAIAALELLGPKFEFLTSLKRHHHDYYIQFRGDPTFTKTNLYQMLSTLKAKGVKTISGNFYIDESWFKGPGNGLGIVADDLNYGFAAPIESIIISKNTVPLNIKQNSNGVSASSAEFFPVTNRLQLVSNRTLKKCVFVPHMTDSNHIILGGCLPDRKTWQFKLAVKNPVLYAKNLVRQDLNQLGIRLKGQILTGQPGQDYRLLDVHKSRPLGSLLGHMLRVSDNIYAGAITKQIGRTYYGVGSMKAGVSAIDQIVTKMGKVKFGHIEIEDGAGASRYNHISPKAIADILIGAYHDKKIRTWLFKSLPVSGQTGTLAYRMCKKPLLGKIHAKTGSMTGVSTLSGYMKGSSGRRLVFAIMMNNFTYSLRKARSTQDAIVKRIYRVF